MNRRAGGWTTTLQPRTKSRDRTGATSYRLFARVSSDDPPRIRAVLERYVGHRGQVTPIEDGFEVRAQLVGASARDLNRELLSELRSVVRRTRLRSEWSQGATTERFFDYVPKGVRPTDVRPPPERRSRGR